MQEFYDTIVQRNLNDDADNFHSTHTSQALDAQHYIVTRSIYPVVNNRLKQEEPN